jgi:hyperosmotically inducible protein
MNIQKSRKIVIAGCMAVAVGIGLVTFARSSHPGTPVAETPGSPSPVAETPAAAPAVVAQIPDAPAAAAPEESVGPKSADTATPPPAAEPKPARNRHSAEPAASVAATDVSVTRAKAAAVTNENPAAETVASNVDHPNNVDALTTPPAMSGSLTDDQKAGTSAEPTASDSQITTDVKSAIAGDSLSKDLNIGVSTTHGVVALSGSLSSKDVKSVDISALILASL